MNENNILPVNQENGMDDHFTSNICRSFFKVIHDREKPQNTEPGLLLG